MEYYVYAYLDPRKPGKYDYGDYTFNYEPFYIGKGKDDRLNDHLRPKDLSYNSYKSNKIKSILDIGLSPIILKVEEKLSEKKSLETEKSLIKKIGRYKDGGVLTNIKIGGQERSGYKHNYNSIKKQIEKQNVPIQKLKYGKVIKEYKSLKIATDMENYGNSFIMNCCKGRTKPKDGTDFRYKDMGLREKYEEVKKEFKHKKQNKEVYYFDKDYKLLGSFDSIREAERETGILRSHISKDCRNMIRMTDYPYFFSFNETYETPVDIRKIKRKVIKMDLNNNILNQYNSVTEASELNGVSRGTISGCLNKRQKTAGGYKWEYVDDD